jgi:hypothetical protein
VSHPFIEHEVEQRSEEWRRLRLGRLTGSRAGAILATIRSGEAAARRNLRLQLVLERLTGRSQESDYVSPAMQAGIDREDDAFACFEALTGQVVQRCGFLAHPELMAGCSLDGYIGNFDKLLSIKCRQPAAHLEFLRTGKIPADAFAQIQHELWLTSARAHDYFSWNPDFPEALQAKWVTVTRNETDIAAYELAARLFLSEVDKEVIAVSAVAAQTEVA